MGAVRSLVPYIKNQKSTFTQSSVSLLIVLSYPGMLNDLNPDQGRMGKEPTLAQFEARKQVLAQFVPYANTPVLQQRLQESNKELANSIECLKKRQAIDLLKLKQH